MSSLAALLGPLPPPVPVAGVEHEYMVRAGGQPVDFRLHVDGLGLGSRVDPGDKHAHRGEWGGVVTADGWEAEVATPPVPLERGFAGALDGWARAGVRALEAALPEGWELEGYSTHVSVEVDDRVVVTVARAFAAHFAPAMMLMLDRRTSPGLLVRPRRHRLEVCGEFLAADDLADAALFAVGAARACAAAVADAGLRRVALPPAVRSKLVPAKERYGTYVDRAAFGGDLYAGGRSTSLRVGRREWVSAGDHLAAAWRAARPHVEDLASAAELARVDAKAAGELLLPLERRGAASCGGSPVRPVAAPEPADLSVRERPGLTVTLETATWDVSVWKVEAGERCCWTTVPRLWLAPFLDALDAGRLDRFLEGQCVAARERSASHSLRR